jgi:hypothetical protein
MRERENVACCFFFFLFTTTRTCCIDHCYLFFVSHYSAGNVSDARVFSEVRQEGEAEVLKSFLVAHRHHLSSLSQMTASICSQTIPSFAHSAKRIPLESRFSLLCTKRCSQKMNDHPSSASNKHNFRTQKKK